MKSTPDTKKLPNTPHVNRIAMGNTGFGSLLCFAGVPTMLSLGGDKTSES